ncbi:Fe2+-enterobactin ABC transporter substrate-binding protein [Glutamicibacter sp. JL.03c]|uniref:Fe2+-enterobactin ABC transporter substrate-binding protein n=1 Tax=Glutamicibacter sp. JL.03c TaxID=2984842 RepID=UPI0021F7540A|nr:Fe2+-enterobactin ABC transporter substrate-binding protein [Glutamicibacter sp. JL.03c]UYQ77915.1 Fe2+-enterobactin ABC transporter substrate-binding protein [Glutamicibacter sp. JL.03c]
MHSILPKAAGLILTCFLALSLGACTSAPNPEAREASTATVEADGWPRMVTDETGDLIKIPSKPERIVSTSVSVTGTLLSLDAPVVGTAVAPQSPATDKHGFLSQWADVASKHSVDALYEIGSFDLEAIRDRKPDLILVSASGADSELEHLDQLRDIAPTLLVDYTEEQWTSLSADLAKATGTEAASTRNNEIIKQRFASLKESLAIPSGTTASILSYHQGNISPVAQSTGPHAQLFEALGFTVVDPPEEFDTSTQEREDFSFTSYDGLAKSLSGDATFLLSSDPEILQQFSSDETLAHIPSIRQGNVFALQESFLMDFYSAQEILDYFDSDYPGLKPETQTQD